MTDRGRAALRQSPDALTVGPSEMRWHGDRLVMDLDEIASPPRIGRIRGTVTLTPGAVTGVELSLSRSGGHVWRPFAPVARIAVDLEAEGWQWEGHGYLDANFGDRALERDFDFWTWGRYPTPDGGALVVYDAARSDGTSLDAAFRFAADGTARAATAPPRTAMRRSGWGVRRATRADPGTVPRQVMPMLDAPFYARSVVATTIDGARLRGVHEALDLRRFASPLIKPMLALRVPRRRGWPTDQA
nr:carotenoid 1,2-hydratase [Jannaschia sp. S6380]